MSAAPNPTPSRRTVVIVRHGKAESSDGRDQARRLTSRGHADSQAAGTFVAAVLASPGTEGRVVALVSSATRAYETWQHVAASLGAHVEVDEQVRDDLYEAGVDDVVAMLGGLGDDVGTALVVAHDPTMRGTVHTLAGDGDPDALNRLEERGFPTASVAALAFTGAWADLGPDACRLESFDIGRS